ncbi:MAG: hypothetical protein HGA76_04365 [Candidatus Firestonebacteria bacterium]|nr:hypothetical protein [Candidatus Firestonebacteria bacterium]
MSWVEKKWVLGLCWLVMAAWLPTSAWCDAPTVDQAKPRLVMVKVPHWKVSFFNLPDELPVLLPAGETFDPARRQYDFSEGMEAMEVFVKLRSQDDLSPTYRLFLQKWPLYQKFFQAVDAENFEQARSLIESIRRLDPGEPAVHFYKGSLHSQAGEYAAAESEYQRCRELFPAYAPVYINLARLAMARQAKKEAQQYLQQALARATDDEQAPTRRLAEQMLQSLNP